MSDYPDIRRVLSRMRTHKFGPMPGEGQEGRAKWLGQLDACAKVLGLPNVYRTHPWIRVQRATPHAAE